MNYSFCWCNCYFLQNSLFYVYTHIIIHPYRDDHLCNTFLTYSCPIIQSDGCWHCKCAVHRELCVTNFTFWLRMKREVNFCRDQEERHTSPLLWPWNYYMYSTHQCTRVTEQLQSSWVYIVYLSMAIIIVYKACMYVLARKCSFIELHTYLIQIQCHIMYL